jgi:hypothetical protein
VLFSVEQAHDKRSNSDVSMMFRLVRMEKVSSYNAVKAFLVYS